MVYVISQNKKPLMPCSNAVARLLLQQGRAKVKRREPFTIQLTYGTTSYTQPLTLGVDTGSGIIGTAVARNNGDIVYLSEVSVRNDIADKMKQRAQYRRNRRNRKTRYREPRFMNRKNSIRSDRFSPTMTSKFHSHEKEIRYIMSILPVTTLVLETGTFDPHLLKNPALADPDIRRWGYQQGPNYGYENTRAMVLSRDGHTCRCCGGKRKDSRLEVHHIIYRSHGGSDDPENLVTLCHTCHKKLHDGNLNIKANGLKKGTLKHATQMNSIRKQLLRLFPEAIETFGYVTTANRERLNVEKAHCLDACMIASNGTPFTIKSLLYRKRCVPEGDFQKTKGIRSEQRLADGKICGFRKFDKVRYMGHDYFIKGRMQSGYAVLMDLNGEKADFSGMPKGRKTPKLSRMRRLQARTSWMTITEELIQNTA